MAYFGDGSNLTGVSGIPSGFIGMWYGATNAIPSGWVLCDGQNNTPDLRDKFVVGASDSTGDTTYPGVSPGATGGSATDTVNITVSGTTGFETLVSGGTQVSTSALNRRHTHDFSGSGSDTVNTLPPYYALAYIMKT